MNEPLPLPFYFQKPWWNSSRLSVTLERKQIRILWSVWRAVRMWIRGCTVLPSAPSRSISRNQSMRDNTETTSKLSATVTVAVAALAVAAAREAVAHPASTPRHRPHRIITSHWPCRASQLCATSSSAYCSSSWSPSASSSVSPSASAGSCSSRQPSSWRSLSWSRYCVMCALWLLYRSLILFTRSRSSLHHGFLDISSVWSWPVYRQPLSTVISPARCLRGRRTATCITAYC